MTVLTKLPLLQQTALKNPNLNGSLVHGDLSSGKVQGKNSIHQFGTTSKKAPSALDITFSLMCQIAGLQAESHLISSRIQLSIFNKAEGN